MKLKLCMIALAVTAAAFAHEKADDSMKDCPMHAEHQAAKSAEHSDAHYAGVDSRGDHAMGFSHTATTHHFRVLADGGAIEAEVLDPADTATTTAIRQHMQQIAKMFTAGNFETPFFIHDRVPPGVPNMQKLGAEISYRYEQTEKGARIRISTGNADALKSIHEFLKFQINEHRTGDKP
jgi:hypothetical protein